MRSPHWPRARGLASAWRSDWVVSARRALTAAISASRVSTRPCCSARSRCSEPTRSATRASSARTSPIRASTAALRTASWLVHRPAQLAHALLERGAAAGQLAGPGIRLGAQPLARHLHHRVDRGVDRGPHGGLVRGAGPGLTVAVRPLPAEGRPRGGDAGPEADDHAHDEQCCIHGRHVTSAL